MTQSELRIYINTLAAEAMKDLRRLDNEIKKVLDAANNLKVASRGMGRLVDSRDVETTRRLNTELNTGASRAQNSARSYQNLMRAQEQATNATAKLQSAQAIAATKMDQGTASATQLSAAYGRVAASAAASSAAQARLAGASAAAGLTSQAAAASRLSVDLLKTERSYIGLQRSMGEAAARGDEFGHRTTRSLFDTLAAVNDNESAMRKWGSQIQWTGRQMISNLTFPLGMIAGMGGKVWFDQAQAMVQVEKVYGDLTLASSIADSETQALEKSFTELSNTFGINREEVIGVAAEWAAAGASGVELAKATNLTMQAMVLGNLSAEESTQALIATQAQYGISTDEMTRTLAQFNLVENETGVTMGGLIKAFSRTAGVAREAGMDTGHLASMIAAMTPAAGTASEAGNGLKTIMTRLMRQTKDTTQTLEYMNINMEEFASLPMDQKLMEVAKGFENLDDAQKGAAAGILAGGWQVNRMSVALRELTNENGYYHKSLKALSDEERVRMTMMRELQKTLTSDPKRLQQAWQSLRNSLAEIFVPIVPYLIYFTNAIAQMAQKFTELPLPIQKLLVAIGMFLALLGPLITAMGVFALIAASLKTPFAILGIVLKALLVGPLAMLGKGLVSLGAVFGITGARVAAAGALVRSTMFAGFIAPVGATTTFVAGRMSAMTAMIMGRLAAIRAALVAHAAANVSLTVGQWVAMLSTTAAGWATQKAMLVTNLAANWAAIAGYWASVRAANVANTVANLAVIARYWAARTTITLLSLNSVFFGLIAHWAKLRAADVMNTVANLAVLARYNVARVLMFLRSFNLVSAGLLVHWAKMKAIELGGWITSNVTTAAGLLTKTALWVKSLDRITLSQIAFWIKTNLMAKAGLMNLLKTVGAMLLRVVAVFVSPWGLAIAAVLGLLYVFRNQIKQAIDNVIGYFQNLPPGMAKALQPIANLWNRIVSGAQAAFNALPGFIQAPLVAVVKIVKAAAMKIYELFSYINPFARHSPSLVENVNAGMDAIANRFGLAATQVGGHVGKMYQQIKALKDAAAGLDEVNANAKRDADIAKIQQGGGPNAGAQVAGYNAISATVATLKNELTAVDAAVIKQERHVKSLETAVANADAAIEGMNETLDVLKLRAEAVNDQLDAAKERMEYFQNATIQGMGAAEDAAFANEMAQKRLQLQMAKLGDSATEGADKARDEYAKLQGDIETMSGKRMELQFAGAGSDVLGGYDSIISGLKGQQLEIGMGGGTGPAAEIDALQEQLDELQRQAEIMDLEKALKFDPLARQIEKVTSNAYELPFDTIVSGLRTSGAQVDSLSSAYDRANAAVAKQQATIDAATAARDQLSKTYDAENEALSNLKTVYDGVEQAIRDGEQALNDMVSSADTAIQRVEELERKREEATRKAEQARKKASGKDGSGGTLSPNMQSLIAAEGSDPFPEVGGSLAIGRDPLAGIDQTGAIEALDFAELNGVAGLVGDIDMMSPFKDAWQKVKDWWNGVVFPLGDPLKKAGDEVGNIIQMSFGGEATGPLSTFAEKLESVGNFFQFLWNVVKGFGELLWGSIFPAIKELGENLKNSLGSELQTIGELFQQHWPSIQKFGEMLWEIVKIVGILAGIVTGVLLGVIILTISVVANIASEILPPIVAFIGKIIEAIINVVMGAVEIITGLWNIIVGLFTGDWSRVWDGIKLLGQGIWNIIKGTWDAIVAVFKGAWDLLYGIVKGLVEGIIDFFTTLWRVLVGNSIVPDMIIAIIDWFKSLPGAVFEFVKSLVDGVVGFFMEMPGRVWNTLVDLKNTIVGFFSGAKDWLFDAGKNIIEGLIDGAGNLLGKLGEFFADKIPAGIIRDGFKKALGIQSPAREMMGPGADVVRGIMAGAESEMPALDSLMSNVADVVAATEIVAPTVQAAGTALPALPDAEPAQDAAPVGITPEQAAEALAAFAAFDAQYDLAVAAHTAGIVAKYSAMYASIAAQQGASHAAQLAAFTAYSASFVAAVTSMAAAVVAQYTSMTSQNTALLNASTAAWLTIIITFINNFLAQWTTFINNILSATGNGVNGITSLWQTLAANLGSILNDSIRPVFESFLPMLETLEGWFRSTVDNIGAIWGEVEPKTKGPARVVINDVYNTGLRTAWNNFNEFLGLKPLPEYTAKFAIGGPVDFHNGGSVFGPGTSLSDSIPARLSRGEHVIPADEVRSAGGHRAIEAQRAAWKAGQVYADGPRNELVQAFARGGAVGERGYKYGGAIIGPGFRGGTPQMDSIANLIGKYFPGMTLVSGWRFTDRLNHSKGLAVDASNVGAGVNSSPQLQAMSRFFYQNYKPMLNELIHYPTNGFRGVSMGRDFNFNAGTNNAHRDHLHVSSNLPLPAPGTPIIPIMSMNGAGGEISMDWGAYIEDAFKQAFDPVREKAPKFAGGIGEWVPKSIEKAMTAQKFLREKAEEMNSFMGTIDDSAGAAERWRPMMKAALLKQGLPEWANNPAILDRFIRQIWTESKGNPNIAQQIVDMNGTGEAAGVGLGQAIPGTWAAYRDPSLPDNRRDPWAMTNFMARYVRRKYGPQGYLSIGNGIGYDQGGVMPPTPGGFGTFYNHTGGPEAVLTGPQWDAVYRASMATIEAEEVARGFRNAVQSMEYGSATEKAAQQIVRNFGPSVDELGISYYDASKVVADTVEEQTVTWRTQFEEFMAGVQSFTSTVSDLYTTGKDIYTKLEEDGVIKKIEESTQKEVAALQDIAKRVSEGAEINEALLREVGHNLSIVGAKAFEILAAQPFETYAPIFDKLAELTDMLPKVERSYVPWAGLETDMTLGKAVQTGLVQLDNTVKGLYNIVQSVASPILRNVSGIGGVISRFATENSDAVTAIMAAVTTGNPMLALPFLPQILDALVELIPMVIQAIIDIVPNLIQSIIDFFDFLNPFNVPSYDTLEDAVKAANEASADVRSGKYQYERGANSDWRPTDDGTTQMNFYGDLSFPNVKNSEDASGFIDNLSRM